MSRREGSPHLNLHRTSESSLVEEDYGPLHDARPLLPRASFFLGDLRDGLPMLNMQAVFLISSKGFTEKQIGVLFLVFGLSQFLFMAPAGYFLDYSHRKLEWVSMAGIVCAILTVLSAVAADADHFGWMIVMKVVQGAITAILPPGFNGITLGIVGSTGFTYQVSRNRMMNHMGTALVVAIGSLIAFGLYPNIGALFVVSPLAAFGVWYNLRQIIPNHVHRDAARGLIIESPTMGEYEYADDVATCKKRAADMATGTTPSWDRSSCTDSSSDAPSREEKDRLQSLHIYNSQSSASSMVRNLGYDVPAPPPSEIAGPRVDVANRRGSLKQTSAAPTDAAEAQAAYQPPDLLGGGLDPPSASNTNGAIKPSLDSPVVDPRQPLPQDTPANNAPLPMNRDASDLQRFGPSQGESNDWARDSYASLPSFNFGWAKKRKEIQNRPRTPMAVLMNPPLLVFTAVIFFFHLANSSVLPLVMQSLALRDVQSGILMSGLCILIAQGFMAFFAKLCGDYSPYWGRKNLILVGLVSLTLRCFLLTLLVSAEESVETERGAHIIKALILSTQFLDSVGAGILGTLQILVTNDLSGGTGRFSLLLGFTTAAMCLGATVSGYLGQAVAQDYGYPFAFTALGLISLIPFALYVFFMPETLPDYARPPAPKKRRRRLRELLKKLNDSRRRILSSNRNPFRRKQQDDCKEAVGVVVDASPLAKASHHLELV